MYIYVISRGPLLVKSTTQLTFTFAGPSLSTPQQPTLENHINPVVSHILCGSYQPKPVVTAALRRESEGTELGVKPAEAAAGRAKPIE